MSPDRSSTIGRERETNPALDVRRRAGVRARDRLGLDPAGRRRPSASSRSTAGPWVALPDAARASSRTPASATVLDVRPFAAHAAGHLPGALACPCPASSFGTKAGFVLDPGEPIVLHASSPAEAARGGAEALGGRAARPGGLRPAGRHDRDARDRRRRRAEAAARRGRRAADRRPRGERARRRLHPGLAEHPLPAAAPRRLGEPRRDAAGGHDLRGGPARRDRRVAAAEPGLRRARRWPRAASRTSTARRLVPPLRRSC